VPDVSAPTIETRLHSFIVKVWTELTDEKTGATGWRGHITHVPSGRRVYITDLDELREFIRAYLVEMGADLKQGLRKVIGKWI
jgi:hypothetical protein